MLGSKLHKNREILLESWHKSVKEKDECGCLGIFLFLKKAHQHIKVTKNTVAVRTLGQQAINSLIN